MIAGSSLVALWHEAAAVTFAGRETLGSITATTKTKTTTTTARLVGEEEDELLFSAEIVATSDCWCSVSESVNCLAN